MDEAQHRELAGVLNTLEGSVVLSGYPSDLYNKLYRGWNYVERPALADGARPRIEVLWIKPAAAVAQDINQQAEMVNA